MEELVEITLKLPIAKAISVLEFVRGGEPGQTNAKPTAPVDEFRILLDAKSKELVSYFAGKNGTIKNSELAKHLGFASPRRTSNALTTITYKLRKIGVDSENWYRKDRSQGETLLRLREDVLRLFSAVTSK